MLFVVIALKSLQSPVMTLITDIVVLAEDIKGKVESLAIAAHKSVAKW